MKSLSPSLICSSAPPVKWTLWSMRKLPSASFVSEKDWVLFPPSGWTLVLRRAKGPVV
jgi:hypothetical protein